MGSYIITRRIVVLIAALLASSFLFAQNPEQIKSDSKMIWAEGSSQKEALDGITSKLAYAVGFTCQKSKFLPLMQTYAQDIRKVTHQITYSGKFLRYISTSDLPKLFQARRQKIGELKSSADKYKQRFTQTGSPSDAEDAATLYRWAIAYLSSLPGGNSKEIKSLQQQINSLQKSAGKSSAINASSSPIKSQMAHINRQASQIESILGIRSTPLLAANAKSNSSSNAPSNQPFSSSKVEVQKPVRKAPALAISLPESPAHNDSLVTTSWASDEVTKALQGKLEDFVPSEDAHIFIIPQIGFSPEWNAGAMLGVKFKNSNMGIYASYRSNFTFVSSDLSIDSSEEPSHLTGSHKVSLQSATAGLLFQFSETPRINLYAGAGYGNRNVYWQTTSNQWAEVTDRTTKGLVLEAGILYSPPKHFWHKPGLTLSAGLSTISFKTIGLTLGIGLSF
ncbi:MAG: outer membrane beta-barrel protein [Bacteroidales bacterium]|nr:outer membrane beta-barrel protein [Bacteroidales bacterium]